MTFLSYIYVCQQSVNTKHLKVVCWALPTNFQGKEDIVFRLIIEYSSLRDFYRPLGNNNNNNRSIFI
jgi:3-polyprenyl-4-hydroxybenzoate decarboxylase